MPNVSIPNEFLIKPTVINKAQFLASPDVVQSKLNQHKAVLESIGITSLSGLGKLSLQGKIVPQPGITKPSASVYGAETLFQSAFTAHSQIQDSVKLVPTGGKAVFLKAVPLPKRTAAIPNKSTIPTIPKIPYIPNLPKYQIPRSYQAVTPRSIAAGGAVTAAGTIELDTAYWVAEEIHLESNTTVVLKNPQKYLILLAEKITVGTNVTFTWERPDIRKPQKRAQLSPPPERSISNSLSGVAGIDGIAGVKGEPGFDGTHAPELEVWVLEMIGRPIFDLRGQDGTDGGDGQDGQAGGKGSKGKKAVADGWGFCKSGAGSGGNGGRGGVAGHGGDGGDGGRGGKLSLFAPQTVLDHYSGGFNVAVEGGRGGAGGSAGIPGPGGEGGAVGDSVWSVEGCGPGTRTNGQMGPQGAAGVAGLRGTDGNWQGEPVSFKAIDADEYRRKLLEPAVYSTSPDSAFAGDKVTLYGSRFTRSDVATVGGAAAQTQVYSDSQLQLTVPALQGGSHAVQVKQSDGTLSNRGTIYVLPKLIAAGQSRVRPGDKVKLSGSGFAEGMMVKVNDLNMPDVRFISPTELEFTLIRPTDVEESEAGEPVSVKVMLSDGTPSNDIGLVLDTVHMLVLGDSIQWGQGLLEPEKFHSLVGTAVQAKQGGIGFYKTVLAHSGATIGAEDTTVSPRLPGEVPTSYPTVMQQVDEFAGIDDYVDLVLMDGGMNDIGITTVLNPIGPDLAPLTKKFFHDDMITLLKKVAGRFRKAKIIVTGYYQPVSENSNLAAVELFLIALGVHLGGAAGGAVGGVLGATQLQQIIARSRQVMNESRMHIQDAIDKVNATPEGGNRILFADPNYGPTHAALTNDPYLYGINLNMTPEDGNVAPSRLVDCVATNQEGLQYELCRVASVGHPNPRGAAAYANAIIPLL
ncbi:IPT/TIG domain-containing protein [Paenibacillus harenae]|uniref:IPT/TIG domain-containing protein n=1 Tax=Paenibacillus harenae TaxID=306543 RepID=UPI0004923732|nr:IPT/TIG domain-containing protein [Paenibacillus harenae]